MIGWEMKEGGGGEEGKIPPLPPASTKFIIQRLHMKNACTGLQATVCGFSNTLHSWRIQKPQQGLKGFVNAIYPEDWTRKDFYKKDYAPPCFLASLLKKKKKIREWHAPFAQLEPSPNVMLFFIIFAFFQPTLICLNQNIIVYVIVKVLCSGWSRLIWIGNKFNL